MWFNIFKDQFGGLGITQSSITSGVADMTGNDSPDAVVKINRLANQKGHSFCNLANWKFLRSDINFEIDITDFKFSGAGILPTTFKRCVSAYLMDGTDRYDLVEVGIEQAYEWINPTTHARKPWEFVITRNESGFWEIQFNRRSDKTYTIFMEIELQWVNLTSSSSETVITKQYTDAFIHYVGMARFIQQGDTENYLIAKKDWTDPQNPRAGIMERALSMNKNSTQRRGTRWVEHPIDEQLQNRHHDYHHHGHDHGDHDFFYGDSGC